MTPGGAASGRKGSKYERKLVNAFGDAGWFAMRCPSSGSATADDLPDVIAMNPTSDPFRPSPDVFFIEHKSGDATTLYVSEDEVEALRRAARMAGATPLLGGRSTERGTSTDHYLIAPDQARITDGGNYGLPLGTWEDIEGRAYATVREDGEVVP